MKIEIDINLNISVRIIGNKLVLRENNGTNVINLENSKYVNCWGRKTIPSYVLYAFLLKEIVVYYYEGNGRFLGGSFPLPKRIVHTLFRLILQGNSINSENISQVITLTEVSRYGGKNYC